MTEYRVLQTPDDFDQVTQLQREVFGFSDLEILPPPLLGVVARNLPPLGLHMGAFVHAEAGPQMVAAILSFATFLPGAAYTVLLGVLPEFQNGPYGTHLLHRFRDEALARGIRSIWGVFDPLDPRLARLYVGNFGFVGTQILGEKMLFRWDLDTVQPAGEGDEVQCPLPGPGTGDRTTTLGFLEEYLNRRGHALVGCLTQRQGDERRIVYVLRPSR